MASIVERNSAGRIDSPHGHNGRQELGNARPLPPRRLRCRIVGPTGMLQAWEDLEATSTFLVRVDLAVQAVHSLQAGLQFRGRPARPRLAPPGGRPLGTLDDPVLLGASRVVPVHPDAQADQPQRQVGRELAPRAPGPAVVDSEAAGQPPANPGQAELCPHGLEGDLLPSPEGGKPQSTAPRRCIRRSDEANLLLHEFLFGYVLLHPSARSHGARSPGRGGSLVVVPPGPETGRLVRTNVGAFAPRGRVVPSPPGGAAHGSGQPPRWGALGAGSRRSPPARRTQPRGPRGASNQVGCRRCRGDETAGGDGGRWSTASPTTRRSGESRSLFARAGASPDGSGRGWDVA